MKKLVSLRKLKQVIESVKGSPVGTRYL